MRLVFMGSPDFAVPALQALVGAGHGVAAVYCQPPRPAGRGQTLQPCPVQRAAETLGLLRSLPGVEMLRGNTDRYVLTGEQPAPHLEDGSSGHRIHVDIAERGEGEVAVQVAA